jgi:hypothetical protein
MNRRTTQLVLLAIVVLVMVAPAFAQETPVPIVVDTNEIFTQTNTWIEVFLPIIAIGVGISVALAILTFIGNQIVKAIRGN